MLEEKDSHEGPIRFLTMFQHTGQPSIIVKPTERPFHLPPLTAIAAVMHIFGGAAARNGDMVLPISDDRDNAPLAQGAAMRFTIVAFVQPQAVGFALTLADANAVDRLQQFGDVIAVGLTQSEVQWMPMGVDDQMAFQPFNLVFSREPNFLVRPFLDFTTLAS
jgi:hypothetical protein